MFVRITIQIQEFQTDFLKLLDSANSNNFEGSAVLAKACGLRVLLVMLKIISQTRTSADADKPARRPVIGSDDARPSYCVFCVFKKAAVRHLGFYVFAIFMNNSNMHPFLRRHAKFDENRTIHGRVIAYF